MTFNRYRGPLLGLALLFSAGAQAAVDPYSFATPEQEAEYQGLIEELRCLVCQNQNLADSNAELAVDLRRQVKEMVATGSSRQQVVDYMVDRYGDFVLYRPPVKSTTWLLWFGPLILLFVAGLTLAVIIRRRATGEEGPPGLSDEERARAEKLLQDNDS
ncbi:cytochrome c-type biogenesis protein [Endothiovibrio diazotrophicus]